MTMCFFASLLICLQSSPARWRQLKHMVTTQKWNPLGGEAAIWHRPASRPQWPAAYGAVDSSSWEALSEKIVRYLAATSQSCQAGFCHISFGAQLGRDQWQAEQHNGKANIAMCGAIKWHKLYFPKICEEQMLLAYFSGLWEQELCVALVNTVLQWRNGSSVRYSYDNNLQSHAEVVSLSLTWSTTFWMKILNDPVRHLTRSLWE